VGVGLFCDRTIEAYDLGFLSGCGVVLIGCMGTFGFCMMLLMLMKLAFGPRDYVAARNARELARTEGELAAARARLQELEVREELGVDA
jgi:hypothetical protein